MVGIMNNKAAIRELICPKQHWVPDDTVACCLNCNKEFIPLFRWKHHCRFCGRVFCSKCCEQTISGEEIEYQGEKKLRHCEKCHQHIIKKGKERKESTKTEESTQHKISCYTPEGDQPQQLGFFVMARGLLEEQANRRLKTLAREICRKSGVDEKVWGDRLGQLAWKAATETTADGFLYHTPFSIEREVKVVTIVSPSDSVSAICFKGLILQRNSPSKQLDSHFKRPKILTVGPAIEAESLVNQQVRDVHFSQIVKNESTILRQSLQQMSKLKAKVIFVGEHICRPAFDYFVEKGVLVMSKIRSDELAMIERLGQVRKRIQNLVLVQKYRPGELVGECDRIYFKTVSADKMLMFIEKEAGIRSVLLGDSTHEVNQLLKSAFKELLLAAWMADKQLQMISRDMLLKPNCPAAPLISSIEEAPTLSKVRSSFEIPCSKIVYKTTKITQVSKSFAEYMSRKGINRLAQICRTVTRSVTSPYQGKDINLGTYLLQRLTEAQTPCRRCQLPHIQRYYLPEGCVNVESEFELSRRKGYIEMTPEQLEDEDHKGNQEEYDPARLYKTIIKRFRDNHDKLSFHLCFRCTDCLSVLGSPTLIGNSYLNISLAHFLSEVSQTKKYANIKEDNVSLKESTIGKSTEDNWLKSSGISSKSQEDLSIKSSQRGVQSQCMHHNVVRVIQAPKVSIKFMVTPYEQCSISDISMSPSVVLKVESKDERMMRDLYAHQIQSKRHYLDEMKALLARMPFLNASSNLRSVSIAGVPPHNHVFYQHFYKLEQLVLHLQMEVAQIQNSLPSYFEKQGHDWTIVMRRFHKVEHVLLIVIACANHIESGMKKSKLTNKDSLMSLAVPGSGNNVADDLNASQIIDFLEIGPQNQFKESLEVPTLMPKTTYTHSTIINTTVARKQTAQQEIQGEIELMGIKKALQKQRFTRFQGTHLYFPIGNTKDPVSILACCLNSQEFSQELKTQSDEMSFKVAFLRDLVTDWQVAQQAEKTYLDLTKTDFQRGESIEYSLSVYYHHEFEELRQSEGLNFELYLRSLYGCRNWDSSGGKSNSSFSKSHNDLLVVKIINSKEFVEFQKFAPAYLRYMRAKREKGELSCLAKIFGIYEATIKNKIYKFVVMQNAFLGVESVSKVYDLKGSEVNRLATPAGKSNFTGLDTNFIMDKDGEPYFLPQTAYTPLMRALQDDAGFLRDQSVIDYSLLVIEAEGGQLRLAIIDFMRPYHLIQKIETIYKEIKSGKDPTVIPPQQYSQRFVHAMYKYFAPTPTVK